MMKFLSNTRSFEEANVVVFGVPLGENSKLVLQNLRRVSQEVEPFDLKSRKHLLEGLKIYDAGDLELKPNDLDAIFRKARRIRDAGKVPVILGGEHLLTLYALGIKEGETKVVVWDAHFDAKDEKGAYTHSTWLRRFIELAGPQSVMVVGVRSCDEEELDWVEGNGIVYLSSERVERELQACRQELQRFVAGKKVYVSLDVDVFDPSLAPAVSYPEPNGITFHDFLELIQAFEHSSSIMCIDLVEIKSMPHQHTTEFLAVYALLYLLSKLKCSTL